MKYTWLVWTTCFKIAVADVDWVMFSGVDVMSFLSQYKNQIGSLHLNDFKTGFTQENCEKDIVAVGTGSLPLNEFLNFSSGLNLPEDGIIIDWTVSLVIY